MLKISSEQMDKFNTEFKLDSQERFIYYLFDNYSILKTIFNYQSLFDLYELKKVTYDDEVYFFMEAEVVLGEFYSNDPYFSCLNVDLYGLDFSTKKIILSDFLTEYKAAVYDFFTDNMDQILTSKNDVKSNFMKRKSDFLKLNFDFKSDNYNIEKELILGANFSNSNYYGKEFLNGL